MPTFPDITPSIDPDLHSLLPPLTESEMAELRLSIEREGKFHTPIFLWGQHSTIIDGHHRWEIWCALPDDTPIKPPRFEFLDTKLAELSDVREWIVRNQAARRNITPQQLSLLRGRCYLQEKAEHGGDRRSEDAGSSGQSGHLKTGPADADGSSGQPGHLKTDAAAERVAVETKSSARTVRRDAVYAQAVDRIGRLNSKAKADIESGTLKFPKSAASFVIDSTNDQVAQVLRNLRKSVAWNEGLAGTDPEAAPRNGKADKPDYGQCPACAGTKWKKTEDGIQCAKCKHPHGEPAGDVEDDRVKTQRQKTVKTVEALMRAFDDLNLLLAKRDHDAAINSCKALLKLAKEWK